MASASPPFVVTGGCNVASRNHFDGTAECLCDAPSRNRLHRTGFWNISGYTATDLNHNSGTQTIEEGAAEIIRVALLDPPVTGKFLEAGGEIPW